MILFLSICASSMRRNAENTLPLRGTEGPDAGQGTAVASRPWALGYWRRPGGSRKPEFIDGFAPGDRRTRGRGYSATRRGPFGSERICSTRRVSYLPATKAG